MNGKISISLDALVSNFKNLRFLLGDFICVLKCDAYGHGAKRCATSLYENGARKFAVFSLDEALEIRENVPSADILILGRTPAAYIDGLKKNRFIQTVFSAEYIKELIPYSDGLRTHIKLDTGMNRVGFKGEPEMIKRAFSGFRGEIEGVYTHFHSADCDDADTVENELADFLRRARELEALYNKSMIKHAAASAAAIRFKQTRLDACRIGLALYGYLPDNCTLPFRLKPVMSFFGRVISVRNVARGENIGYGCDRKAERASVIATVACGYADGLPRIAEKMNPLVKGHRVPFAGRICMDRCMLDVTELYKKGITLRPYDKVELLGKNLPVTELARAEKTIPYEILTRVGKMNAK